MSPLVNIRLLAAVAVGLAVLAVCAVVVARLLVKWRRERAALASRPGFSRPGFEVVANGNADGSADEGVRAVVEGAEAEPRP